MNCSEYQQDILLMIHGELGFVDKMRVKAHLSRCADCRKTQDTLAAASHTISAAIRAPEMTPWAPAAAARQRRIPSARTITGIIILLAAGAIFTAAIHRGAAHSKSTIIPAAWRNKCPTCSTADPVVDKCK